jgi:hypothetical protein
MDKTTTGLNSLNYFIVGALVGKKSSHFKGYGSG